MARDLPTLPDEKIEFYRRKLWREVSNLFNLERILVRKGMALFFKDEEAYGYMALECAIKGYNMYRQPTTAYCTAPNDQGKKNYYERTIVHKYDDEIPSEKAGVLINNMYNHEPLYEIVEHYAYRLTLVQNAFDTNALWQNIPVTWSVNDNNMKLSIEKWFADIYSGKPLIMMDKTLLAGDNEIIGNVTEVPFLLDKLMDAKNEVYNEFKASIGLNAPGADKKERLVVAEATSNDESKETCLNIMLSQRKIAAEEINSVFRLNVSVDLAYSEEMEVEEDGTSDDRAKDPAGDDKL